MRVHIAGMKSGTVRVERDATFTVPESDRKMLGMPLSWLCSDVNKPHCDDGFTCDTGACVPSELSELPDHVAADSTTCFDVPACTLTGTSLKAMPETDAVTGDCLFEANLAIPTPINVALLVNTDKVGNAGVCLPMGLGTSNAGNCYVPLAENADSGGFQLLKGGLGKTKILLPPAVCEHANDSISFVAVTHADACASKQPITPSCPMTSPVCVPSAHSCGGLPSSWVGFSCSGSTKPTDIAGSAWTYCGASNTDPVLDHPPLRGKYCCTSERDESGTDPLLIDDMSGGPLIKVRPPADDVVAGSWFTASDDTEDSLSPPQGPTLFTYRDIDPVTPPGGPTITRAACFQMPSGLVGQFAEEGFAFFGTRDTAKPLDVSPYRGIRFWAKLTSTDPEVPQPIRVVFPNGDTDTEHGSTCMTPKGDKSKCDAHGKLFSNMTDDWQEYEVRWSELEQSPPRGQQLFPQFAMDVYSVDFQAIGYGASGSQLPFDFCVSQISFLQ